MNTLSYALLAFLAREESSGYNLMLRLQPFWPAKHSQIYPLLSQMESEELLTACWIVQCEKPDKKLYSITEKGIRKLKEWLYVPLADPITRDELSMKTFCMWLTDLDNAIDIIESRKVHLVKKLEHLHLKIGDKVREDLEFGTPEFFDYMLFQKAIYNVTSGLEWTNMMLDTLKDQRTKQNLK
ncbi:PadR family transcriptional regulator [Paenibacillus macquariensis]|uniref:Virulence activator alpha C-term n=1 Tax=Paenibacillus macquariensis TaxID=948756 RepID=A0ABY1JUE9_9BACL|nr:PadR family transcriptional regulator [Paenibacillus macquariensis]MEC0090957.1 PadR family transcriptional regulator [Paenibacillus macquariensis]OAB34682.1 transcriptional regulator [Paenibacillus macquariensis subsp. macquariensis]SIQ79878.1 Virulence activator alpha C-term [Paenibacillus macquariensis]